jgi:protein-S-isoprenylcysteine O-methyltransferase Ste14
LSLFHAPAPRRIIRDALSADRELFAKASLRRSFGILPADRGVVSRGAYRFVRQPMYLDYFLLDIGFLLVNFGIQNIIVYGWHFPLQVGRIVREEKLPSADGHYRAYRNQVRVPGDSLRILTVYG